LKKGISKGMLFFGFPFTKSGEMLEQIPDSLPEPVTDKILQENKGKIENGVKTFPVHSFEITPPMVIMYFLLAKRFLFPDGNRG